MDPYVLYAMPASFYSGKARSYLRTHRIPYVERAPGDARYSGEIEPTIGRWIIPVLQTPDGTIIQDTAPASDMGRRVIAGGAAPRRLLRGRMAPPGDASP